MDVLTDILGSLRLTGGVIVDASTAGEFCLSSQFTEADYATVVPSGSGDVVAYHFIRSGRVFASVDGHPPIEATEGDIILLPRNDKHLIYSDATMKPVDSHEFVEISDAGPARLFIDGAGKPATFYCGFLGVSADRHPLLDSLPIILKLSSADDARDDWLESSMRLMNEGRQSPDIVSRLAELFFAEAIRRYMDTMSQEEGGWLAGLRDPAVARALAIIHNRFAEDLEIEELAREAGVSRTVLGERFVKLIGEPPMRYCARWRMRVAANMLRDGKANTANIGYSVGFNSEAAFNRAFKREYGEPPATWRRRVEAEARATQPDANLPEQTVRFCTAHDGTRLAWSVAGDGPPLVKTANWLNHLEHDWRSPLWQHWMREFLKGHCLVRYDERANGLSDWDTPEISFEAFVDDLASVVDCAGIERFDLLGISQGAAVAIAYAVRHPERVRKLVLYGGYAQGWATRASPEEVARREAMITLTNVGWGADNPAYRQLFTNLYIPGASQQQADWFTEMQRVSASTENSVKIQRVLSQIDVTGLLGKVRVPTLIAHARDDQVVPFAAGEQLAANIPSAQFVPLDGSNHILLDSEPAWAAFASAARSFLADGDVVAPAVIREAPKDNIRTCVASDGATLAFATSGNGFPMVKAPNWMTNLEHDWDSPVYGHWLEEAARSHRLVRMDLRGFGMSDRDPSSFTFDDLVSDLATVVDEAGVEQCDLFGISHGSAIAITYAARHPERVRRLMLVNSFAAGWRVRADPEEITYRESLLEMNRQRPAFRRSLLGEMFITLYFPSASEALIEWHNEHFQMLGPVKNMEPMIVLASRIDVRADLPLIKAETLVLHADQDGNAPIEAGRKVAEAIAGARFVEIDSANHIPLGKEPAWPVIQREMRAFFKP